MSIQPFLNEAEYVINDRTLLLQPIQHGEHTTVFELGKPPVRIQQRPIHIIRESCLRFLSTYEGRREAAATVLGTNRKVPVAIDKADGTFLFPTHSHLKPECFWISPTHLTSLEQGGKKESVLLFADHQRVLIPCSTLVIKNQVLMTATLFERSRTAEGFIVKEKMMRSSYVSGARNNVMSFFHTPKREAVYNKKET